MNIQKSLTRLANNVIHVTAAISVLYISTDPARPGDPGPRVKPQCDAFKLLFLSLITRIFSRTIIFSSPAFVNKVSLLIELCYTNFLSRYSIFKSLGRCNLAKRSNNFINY